MDRMAASIAGIAVVAMLVPLAIAAGSVLLLLGVVAILAAMALAIVVITGPGR